MIVLNYRDERNTESLFTCFDEFEGDGAVEFEGVVSTWVCEISQTDLAGHDALVLATKLARPTGTFEAAGPPGPRCCSAA